MSTNETDMWKAKAEYFEQRCKNLELQLEMRVSEILRLQQTLDKIEEIIR